MELYFLNRDFGVMTAPIDSAVSVVWSMRFFECGTFRMIFPLDADLLSAARSAVYVCTAANEDGFARCGRIEYIGCTGEDQMEISGRMLESLLSDRVMISPDSITGAVSAAVCGAVSANLRGLPVEISAESAVISDEVTLSWEWDVLSDWVYRMLKPFGASYTVSLNVERSAVEFRIVQPGEKASAVFSSSYENIAEVAYELHSGEMKNVAYIEGYDGTVASVDLSDGGEIREMYQKAGDIRPGQFSGTAAYTEALRLRGRTVLGERSLEEYISCTADSSAEPVYGRDYTLGDMCYVEDAGTGISVCTRVTEADEVWENGEKWVYPAFGEKLPGVKNKLKNI